MRLFVIPFILVVMLVQAPVPALGNTNQQAAEKIANTIGERFPDADVGIEYKGGNVLLKGEAASPDQRNQIAELVSKIPGLTVSEVKNEIRVVAPKAAVPAKVPVQAARPTASPFNAPVPMPNAPSPQAGMRAPMVAANGQQVQQNQPVQPPPPQTMLGAMMAPTPQQYATPAYGVKPGQPSAVPPPYAPAPYSQAMQQPAPQYGQQYQPAYGPQGQAMYHPEAYGPQGPMPGQYNQPNLPDYAWPAYANYPNYAQVTYPRSYSPKAWPYIGPFYPYPQVPLGWRKVTLEHHNGWWWLDFDDGTPSGPFSGLFRQPQQYTY